MKKKVIIIGAGVAGLATATRLATDGFEVIIFEKNATPGGKLTSFDEKGFCFDEGPSLFTSPKFIEELFEYAGEPIDEYFSYKKLNSTCNYFFSDNTNITASSNSYIFAKDIAQKHNETESSVLNYLNNSKKLYNNTGSFFLNHSLHQLKTLFNKNILKAFLGFRFRYIFKSLDNFNKQQFKNPKTVQIFNRFATYNGSSPFLAPAMLSLISHLEFNDGVFYPKGGMISITNALYKLALVKGVKFNFNTEVQEIVVNENLANGVVVNGEKTFCDIVVSNGDVYFTYKNLLNNNNEATKILKQERSSSALIFYWGISKEFQQLDLHNILFGEDYRTEFESIFSSKIIYHDPTIYINITSKEEPRIQAPDGMENWFVMINVPASENINWDEATIKYRKIIIDKINKFLNTDLEELIIVEKVLNPKKIESKTSSYLGSIYGTSSNSIFAAFLRHPNFSSQYKNLYFVGGSVHPGGGIPLCLHSATITSKIIQQKFKTKQP